MLQKLCKINIVKVGNNRYTVSIKHTGTNRKGRMILSFCLFTNVDFSLFRPLEFFVDPKNGDGRNNNPPAMRVRVDCYTKKLPFRVQ